MNVTPTSGKRSVSSTQLWLAAGAAFVLTIVGLVAEQYLWGSWDSQAALLAAAAVKWVCLVAAIVLTIAAIVLSIAATVRRLMR
ncbi:hypothetical protein [Couchioplanes caeruleus]|uniref:Uncharacterized protein n=2 Tax=Couchioplanes caeruleus TaxID=56438 RepID=A0A1K0GYN1_9ACTN|nr:hypothetical protein [Couchioplanes caeruleus]OJF14539.1 hypothetical protein BG844_09415 [Couchioplanes caeruleus subsp. caeruleus]ROP21300.1 hypothetical protein EDD30_7699 [Couchioplanes caeruleus]